MKVVPCVLNIRVLHLRVMVINVHIVLTVVCWSKGGIIVTAMMEDIFKWLVLFLNEVTKRFVG